MLKQVPNKLKHAVLALQNKMNICKRLEKGKCFAVLMGELNVSLLTIYNVKAQSQVIKEFYVKLRNNKSVEKHHILYMLKKSASPGPG